MIEINKENLKQKKFVIEIQPKHFKRAISYDNKFACPLHYALCDVFKANNADDIEVESDGLYFKLIKLYFIKLKANSKRKQQLNQLDILLMN